MSAWFRAYSESLNDPKIQTLPLDAFKAWHNAMYLAASLNSTDGKIGTLEDISFAFRETKATVSSAFHPLIERRLIETDGETFQIVSWKKRQYKSDTSTERVKRFRKRSRNVTETAPDTDTDTDTDTEAERKIPVEDKSSTDAAASDVGSPLPAMPVKDPNPPWWPGVDRYKRLWPDQATDKLAFQLGRWIFGERGGGVVKRAAKATRNDWRWVIEFLLMANDAGDPKAWFMRKLLDAEKDEIANPPYRIYPEGEYRER